jgi:hypothetical protein
MRGSAGATQCLGLNPTAYIGHTAGDLDHAAVSTSNGMKFDVSVEGHAAKMRLQPDQSWPAARLRRSWLPTRLPLPTGGAKDSARLHARRRQACWLQGQRKPLLKISRDLLYRTALVGYHS